MHNNTGPSPDELPSSRTLVKSTLIAAAVALVLLVTVVMPAEYGEDPTGVGTMLGLTRMGQIKMALAREAAAAEAAEAAAAAPDPAALAPAVEPDSTDPALAVADGPVHNTHVTQLTLTPAQGREIKLVMREGAETRFSWSVEGGGVIYDTHGEPFDSARGSYHSYGKGMATPAQEGVIVAAFDGLHGWFWRNRNDGPVTITLRTEGEYQELREIPVGSPR